MLKNNTNRIDQEILQQPKQNSPTLALSPTPPDKPMMRGIPLVEVAKQYKQPARPKIVTQQKQQLIQYTSQGLTEKVNEAIKMPKIIDLK